MGKNQNSVVVLRIWLKFWWMIPMGVRDNHTKFEQKLNGGGREQLSQVADPQFQKLQFRAKNSHFLGQNSPRNTFKTAKQRERVGTLYVRLDFPVSTSSLQLSNSMICPGNGPKKAPRSPKFCVDWLATATNQERAISLATWLKQRFRGHLIHPQSPTFCGFHPSKLPKRAPRPQYLGPLGCGKLQAQTETGGCPNGSTRSNRDKKLISLKNDPRPCVMLKTSVFGLF